MAELIDDVRKAIDDGLKGCTSFTMLDREGHVELVDSDIDTLILAREVIVELNEMGWNFTQTVRKGS